MIPTRRIRKLGYRQWLLDHRMALDGGHEGRFEPCPVFGKSGGMQARVRLGVSIAASSFVTGLGSWGIAVLAGESFLRACAIAAIAISVCVISLWTRSPLTKGIPLCRPGRIEARRIEMLTTENVVTWGTNKEK